MADIKTRKTLRSFSSFVTKDIEVETKRVEGEGDSKKEITEKVIKQEKAPVKIIFYKPSQRQKEEADLETSAYFFKCMDRGLYSKQQLAKVYKDKGGDLSKGDLEYYIDLQTKLVEKIGEVDRANMRESADLTAEEKEAGNRSRAEYSVLRRELIDFESARSAIFEKTADTKAFHRQVNWYKMHLFFKEVDGKIVELFPGVSFEDKLEKYDEALESKDELLLKIDGRISAYTVFWLQSGAEKEADFAPIDVELGIKSE